MEYENNTGVENARLAAIPQCIIIIVNVVHESVERGLQNT